MADVPPPPPGFSIDKPASPPPPPPGFQVDAAPAAHPPPPAGFKLDAPKNSVIMSQIGDALMSVPRAQAAGLKEIYKATTRRGAQSFQDIKGDVTAPITGKPKQGVGNYVSRQPETMGREPAGPLDYAARAGKTALDVANAPFNLAAGPIEATVGRISESRGGPKKEAIGDVGAMLAPFGGEIKAVGKMGAEALGKGGRKILSLPEKAARAAKTAEAAPGLRPSPNITEGPLTETPALKQPRKFEDQLFQLEANRVADKLDVMKSVKNAPDVPAATWEKLYHHEENPEGVALTPEEQQVYDQHVAPLKAESDKLFKDLEGYGYDLGPEGGGAKYTPRYVAGKTRSFGEVLSKWKQGLESKFQGGAAARSMRQTVDAQKSRRFYKAVSPDGESFVVHVGKDGKVSAFDPDRAGPEFGTFPKGQKLAPGAKIRAEGNTWRLEQATTKEIEDVASTRYHKNVLANRLDNVAKLRSAVRNAKFIQDMKSSPEWANVATKTTDVLEPPVTNGRRWRVPKSPQFQGYYMEAPLADALDDAAGRTRDLDGLENGLDKAGNLVKGSIFWNPIPHMRNVANHYFVEKGLVGTATSIPSTTRSLFRAARAVMTQNEDYMRSLRAGASLPYARTITADLHKALTTKLGEDVAKNPAQWGKLAQIAGYANPIEMVKAIYKTSNKALWSFGDILSVARQMELAEKGVPFAKAIKMTEEHMPNYRVPGQVLGQRMFSQVLTSPVATMFGRYQYNRLASYLNMAKDMVSKETSIKDKAAAMDKLAMLGVMLAVYYPMMDKAWQKVTGNKEAKTVRPGAASVPQAGIDLVTGQKGPGAALQSVFSPGVIETPIEAVHGRYLWSGQPIAYPENLTDGHPDQFARDVGAWIGSKISPLGQAQGIAEGTKSPEQFLLQQIGVSAPSEKSVAAKQKYKVRDEKMALHRAVKKAAQRAQ